MHLLRRRFDHQAFLSECTDKAMEFHRRECNSDMHVAGHPSHPIQVRVQQNGMQADAQQEADFVGNRLRFGVADVYQICHTHALHALVVHLYALYFVKLVPNFTPEKAVKGANLRQDNQLQMYINLWSCAHATNMPLENSKLFRRGGEGVVGLVREWVCTRNLSVRGSQNGCALESAMTLHA